MYIRLNLIGIFILITIQSFSQNWQITSESEIEEQGTRDIIPTEYAIYKLDDSVMQALLWRAPQEKDVDIYESACMIEVGLPEGVTERFQVLQYEMMEPELAVKYPGIRTFYGVSLQDPLKRIRIDYTVQGFRAVISSPGKDKIFIDHYQRNDKETRIIYYKHKYTGEKWGCDVEGDHDHEVDTEQTNGARYGDCQLRSYRLAQATTGEYSNFHGATSSAQSALVMAAVVTVINRVNEVYEAEVAVRMVLVANTDLVFYYNSSTDPYSNNDGGTMLGQNITTCNNVIGSANYDIGHVFSTGGGGVAYLSCVCGSNKAGGVTGSGNPVGDPFSIDYVAHEMGHQFGANHTQFNSCNRNDSTAMEPGSASTIMGYAGICSPDVQNNSDAYFHAISIQEIKSFLSGSGNGCAQIVSSFSNSAPVVTAQPNYTIPASTPFVLTLAATDPNGNPMTYAWEQMNGYTTPQTMPPTSANTSGPAFRSIFSTTSSSRYFPPIGNIINNTSNTWQVLPAVARTMNFRGVARDFTGVAGCNSEINITVTTVVTSGAFTVTSQNSASTWYEGQSQTITWDIAGTTANGINCSQVSILLSYDGGYTYPVTLLASTANDGSETIVVPEGLSSTARIMVKAVGNVFFDINNTNITILSGVPTYFMTVDPNTIGICAGGSGSVNVNIERILGYAEPVNLSIANLPAGMNYSFSINPVYQGQNSLLNLTNTGAAQGNYEVSVKSSSGSIYRNAIFNLVILGGVSQTNLLSPADQQSGVSIFPLLVWETVVSATGYELEISRDENFSSHILQVLSTTENYQVTDALFGVTEYFWRVRPVNECSTGSWSSVFRFETQSCFVYKSQDVPLTISPSGTPDVSSYHMVGDKGIITDLDVLNLQGLHTWVDDLRFTLYTPNGTNVRIWNRPCDDEDNFDINFDQSAPAGSWPCPPTDGGTYRPSTTLSTFNTRQIKGLWRMRVQDFVDSDGGSLQNWEIKTCVTGFCRLQVENTFEKGAGSLSAALQCAVDGDTIRFAPELQNVAYYLGDQHLVIDKPIVIEGDPDQNIHIYGNGTSPLIINSAPVSGNGLRIKGLHLHRQNPDNAIVENNGKLILEDVMLYHDAENTHAAIQNSAGSILEFKGNCEVVSE